MAYTFDMINKKFTVKMDGDALAPKEPTPYERFHTNLKYPVGSLHKVGYHYYLNGVLTTIAGDADTSITNGPWGDRVPTSAVKLKTLLFKDREHLSNEITKILTETEVPTSLSRKKLEKVIISNEKIALDIDNSPIKLVEKYVNVIVNNGKGMQWLPILQDILWMDRGWKKKPQAKKIKAKKGTYSEQEPDEFRPRARSRWEDMTVESTGWESMPELDDEQ